MHGPRRPLLPARFRPGNAACPWQGSVCNRPPVSGMRTSNAQLPEAPRTLSDDFVTLRFLALARGALIAAGLSGLVGCGFIKPGTPGHEPPSAGRYNPVSGDFNSRGR